MRLAVHVWPVPIGLATLVLQIALTVPCASAWENNALRSANSSAQPGLAAGRVRFVGAPAIAPSVPRWTNGQASQPAASGGPVSDHAVRQAAWTNPYGTGARSDTARATTPARNGAQALPPGRKGPMFHGFEVRLPDLLFSRKKNPPPAAALHSKTPPHRTAAAQTGPGRPVASSRPSDLPRPSTGSARLATASAAATPTFPGPSPTESAEPTPAATTAAAPATKSPADRLVAQAHEWTSSAQREEDFSRIIETCRRARASQPSEPIAQYANELCSWALNRRGQLKAEAGRTQEAILDFHDAVHANPECWRAIHNRGVLSAQAGQFEKAFDDFNRTIQINPEFAKAHSNRAALFVVANDLNTALQDYGRAIELDPDLAVAHRGRGRVCHLLGRLDEAISHYDAAVQLAPNDAYAVASRADLLTDLGRYVDAAAGYDQAIQLDPQLAHGYSGSAWLLATCPDNSVRNPDLAIERARMAIKLNGKAEAVNFDTLAAAQASAGDFATAMHTIRQAIAVSSAEDRDVYEDRLVMYQHARPYRIAPLRPVTQANYESY